MRLLVLEDEHELAGLIKSGLTRAGFTVDVATTLASGLDALHAALYELVILDRRLPDGDGLQLISRTRKRGQSMPILVLTAIDSLNARVEGLDQGADDYLCKPFKMVELVARIRAILRRPPHLSPKALTAGNIIFDTSTRSVSVAGQTVWIARRECMLLEQLIRRAKHVVTREKLEGVLFGFDAEASQNAIEASVSRLRKVLVMAGADQIIHTVRGVGYCLAP